MKKGLKIALCGGLVPALEEEILPGWPPPKEKSCPAPHPPRESRTFQGSADK